MENNKQGLPDIHPDIDGNYYMSIGGNCFGMFCLGQQRIRGPVDNMMVHGDKTILLLSKNKLLDNFINETPKIYKVRENSKYSNYDYIYSFGTIVHNDATTDKFKKELIRRINIFNRYHDKLLRENNCYFVYSMNLFDVNNNTSILRGHEFENFIKQLDSLHILNKVIFIGSRNTTFNCNGWYSNYHLSDTDLHDLQSRYKIKYIEISKEHCEIDELHDLFLQEVRKIIKGE